MYFVRQIVKIDRDRYLYVNVNCILNIKILKLITASRLDCYSNTSMTSHEHCHTGRLVSAVLFVVLSKAVWVDVFGFKAAIFPYSQPALFAMPVAFLLAFVFSKSDSSVRAQSEIEAFDDQYVRSQTGFGSAAAASH